MWHLESMSPEPTNQKQMKRLPWLLAAFERVSQTLGGKPYGVKCWVFNNCSRLLLQMRAQPRDQAPAQTDRALTKVSSMAELLKVRMFCAQKNQGFTKDRAARDTHLLQRMVGKFTEVSSYWECFMENGRIVMICQTNSSSWALWAFGLLLGFRCILEYQVLSRNCTWT